MTTNTGQKTPSNSDELLKQWMQHYKEIFCIKDASELTDEKLAHKAFQQLSQIAFNKKDFRNPLNVGAVHTENHQFKAYVYCGQQSYGHIDLSLSSLEMHIEFLEDAIQRSKKNVNKYLQEGLPDMSRSCERITNGLLIALENAQALLQHASSIKEKIKTHFFSDNNDSLTQKTSNMDPNSVKENEENPGQKAEQNPGAGQPAAEKPSE